MGAQFCVMLILKSTMQSRRMQSILKGLGLALVLCRADISLSALWYLLQA